jgi:hypothetical protein
MKAIDKVKKLLSLSKSPNQNEAAAALAKAVEICRENDICIEDVEVSGHEEIIHESTAKARQTVPAWESELANRLARLFNCRLVIYKAPKLSNYRIVREQDLQFVGYESDVKICGYVYTYLKRQVSRIATEHMKTKTFRKRHRYNEYKKCYLEGIVIGVVSKVERLFKERQDNNEPGIILKRDAVIDKYLQEIGVVTSNAKARPQKRKDALCAGYCDGKQVALNRGMSGTESQAPKQLEI